MNSTLPAETQPARVTASVPTLVGIAIAVGLTLRSVQYFAGVSLWLDEAALARNIVDRTFGQLAGPLDYGQVAPLGFLWVERAIFLVLGASERALRLPSFVAGILALFLFAVLSARVLPARSATLAAWLFATGVPFIFFGATLKPYAFDVLTSIALTLAVIHAGERRISGRSACGLAVLGGLAWFSTIGAVIVGTAAVLLMMRHFNGDIARRRLSVAVGLSWIVLAAVPVVIARRAITPQVSGYLNRRWAATFVPHHVSAAANWGWRATVDLFALRTWVFDGGLHYGSVWLFVLLMIAGLLWLWTHQRYLLTVMTAPVAGTLLASALNLYPFTGRFVVFALPAVILTIAAGAAVIDQRVRPPAVKAVLPILLVLISIRAVAHSPLPQRVEDLRPVLAAVSKERHPDDAVYVYYSAGQAFLFYEGAASIRAATFVIGRCARGRPEWLIEDLEQLRHAGRLWVILSHAARRRDEVVYLLSHLDATGQRQREILPHGGSDAAAYLYTLNPTGGSSPPVPRSLLLDDAWECAGPVNPWPVRPVQSAGGSARQPLAAP